MLHRLSAKQQSVLYICLWIYSFVVLSIIQYLEMLDAAYLPLKEKYSILIIVLILVEILNQYTYWLARRNIKLATSIRVPVFWIIFTAASIVYITALWSFEGERVFQLHHDVGVLILNIVLSFLLPFYSIIPDFRFWFLKGKFGRK